MIKTSFSEEEIMRVLEITDEINKLSQEVLEAPLGTEENVVKIINLRTAEIDEIVSPINYKMEKKNEFGLTEVEVEMARAHSLIHGRLMALRYVRQTLDIGLREAKRIIDNLIKYHEKEGHIERNEMLRNIDSGQILQAIKAVRRNTNWELKQAKDYVDKVRRARKLVTE